MNVTAKDVHLDGQTGKTVLTFHIEHDDVQKTHDDVGKWHRAEFQGAVAKITELPEFSYVAALEKRLHEATGIIEARRKHIDMLRAECADSVLSDDETLDRAAQAIDQCQKEIARQQICIDAVNAKLPNAIEERRRIAKDAAQSVVRNMRQELRLEWASAAEAAGKAVGDDAIDMLAASLKMDSLRSSMNAGLDFILKCAESAGVGRAG